MKRRTEARSDDPQLMRFFTPELYVQYNSPDDRESDEAEAAWEAATGRYRRHLRQFEPDMPPGVTRLTQLCLHDADLLSVEFPTGTPNTARNPGLGVVSLGEAGKVVTLIYTLWKAPSQSHVEQSWPFSRKRAHWLYDEVDRAPGSKEHFLHRILFSDGRIVVIPFTSVIVHSVTPPARVRSKKSA